MSTALTRLDPSPAVAGAAHDSVFASGDAFALAQRAAKALADSSLVPEQYRGNVANCVLALEVAARVKVSPLAVMQNLYIVQGKPMWSAQFVIAAINASGRFTPLRFRVEGTGDDRACTAWARDAYGDVLEGPPVSITMARDEGWMGRQGSKWRTMPELMLRYRAAAFFGRLYAPDILAGMRVSEEGEADTPRLSTAERADAARGQDGYRALPTLDGYDATDAAPGVRAVLPPTPAVAGVVHPQRAAEVLAQPDPYDAPDASVLASEDRTSASDDRALQRSEDGAPVLALNDPPAPKRGRNALAEGR